jgi:hypothetical protein
LLLRNNLGAKNCTERAFSLQIHAVQPASVRLRPGVKNMLRKPLDNVVIALQTRLAKQVEIRLVVRVGETQRGSGC